MNFINSYIKIYCSFAGQSTLKIFRIEMRKWSIDDSAELYNINGWGLNYFSINEKGHVTVTPKVGGPRIDIKELMEELQVRDVSAPVLLRFPDILDNRIEKISSCFQAAATEYGYTGKNL